MSRGNVGAFLGLVGLVLSYLSLHAWKINDGANVYLAPYVAGVVATFSRGEAVAGYTSTGLSITEELSIIVVGSLAVLSGVAAFIMSFLSVKKGESFREARISLFMGAMPMIMLSAPWGISALLVACVVVALHRKNSTRACKPTSGD